MLYVILYKQKYLYYSIDDLSSFKIYQYKATKTEQK